MSVYYQNNIFTMYIYSCVVCRKCIRYNLLNIRCGNNRIRVPSSQIFNNYCRNYGNVSRKGVVSGYLINDKLSVPLMLMHFLAFSHVVNSFLCETFFSYEFWTSIKVLWCERNKSNTLLSMLLEMMYEMNTNIENVRIIAI